MNWQNSLRSGSSSRPLNVRLVPKPPEIKALEKNFHAQQRPLGPPTSKIKVQSTYQESGRKPRKKADLKKVLEKNLDLEKTRKVKEEEQPRSNRQKEVNHTNSGIGFRSKTEKKYSGSYEENSEYISKQSSDFTEKKTLALEGETNKVNPKTEFRSTNILKSDRFYEGNQEYSNKYGSSFTEKKTSNLERETIKTSPITEFRSINIPKYDDLFEGKQGYARKQDPCLTEKRKLGFDRAIIKANHEIRYGLSDIQKYDHFPEKNQEYNSKPGSHFTQQDTSYGERETRKASSNSTRGLRSASEQKYDYSYNKQQGYDGQRDFYFKERESIVRIDNSYHTPAPGLINFGNTCYMNSIIQCLAAAPHFVKVLFSSSAGPISSNTKKIIQCLLKRQSPESEYLHKFRTDVGERYADGLRQCDAFGFLCSYIRNIASEFQTCSSQHLPRGLSLDVEKAWSDLMSLPQGHSMVDNVFSIIFYTVTVCQGNGRRCSYRKINFEPAFGHRLPTERLQTLYECLSKSFQQRETPIVCPACKVSKGLTITQIWKLPKMLVFQLNKAKNGLGTNAELNKTEITIPRSLDLTQFWARGESPFLPERYSLCGFVEHRGRSFDSGHYTSTCWSELAKSWVHFNDSSSTLVREENVQQAASGRDVLILFYKSI